MLGGSWARGIDFSIPIQYIIDNNNFMLKLSLFRITFWKVGGGGRGREKGGGEKRGLIVCEM